MLDLFKQTTCCMRSNTRVAAKFAGKEAGRPQRASGTPKLDPGFPSAGHAGEALKGALHWMYYSCNHGRSMTCTAMRWCSRQERAAPHLAQAVDAGGQAQLRLLRGGAPDLPGLSAAEHGLDVEAGQVCVVVAVQVGQEDLRSRGCRVDAEGLLLRCG